MNMRQDICGWYTFYYAAPIDSLISVQFTDYFHTGRYTMEGLKAGTKATGAPIDLRPYFIGGDDTAYILPQPFPLGPPVITGTFPGKTGECGVRKISGIFRDWKQDDISFFNNPTGMNGGGSVNMIQKQLTGPDYKPKKTTDASVSTKYADSLNTWFVTKKFANGTDNDTCIDMTLLKGDDGLWTFDSDKLGGFFPLDSFNDSNNIKYLDRLDPKDPKGKMHNFHYTMEMHLQFVYHQGAGLEFDFRGDDDVWIFVNNNLAIDLGGLHENASDILQLDRDRTKLGLVDGQTYSMDIFYCERNPIASNLLIKTTMDLHNSDDLYYKEKVLGSGKIQYDIWQRLKIEGPDCGFTPLLNAETLATVIFFLDGPEYILKELPAGTHFGGIIVDANKSRVTIDSTKIEGLVPGSYTVTYKSTLDTARNGYLVFTVPPFPPDHLDIVSPNAVFNRDHDQPPDTISLNIDLDETQIYAVIRDKNGLFLDYAKISTWKSRNPEIATATPLKTDSSRCDIVKINTGVTWIVVSDPKGKLKPDSIKVNAVYKPKIPTINTAIILDTNADIIPDMLKITLNDTLKTDQHLDSVYFQYRGKTYTVPIAQTTLQGALLTVPLSQISATDGRPSGEVTLVGTTGKDVVRRTKQAVDGVGPALDSAYVLENESQGPDTLFLTFSEPINESTLLGKQLLLIKSNTTDTVPLDVNAGVVKKNDSSFVVSIALSAVRPQAGDRLRLTPGSANGTVSDPSKNTPHDLNRSVLIGFKAGATSIIRAYYLDKDADGFIDCVVAVFKRSVAPSDFKTIKIQWGATNNFNIETISPDALVKMSDSVLSMPVDGKNQSQAKPQTNGAMEIMVEYNSFPDLIRSSTVSDSAAPVILSASLSYGTSSGTLLTLDSTLTVVFSEPLRQAPRSQPFFCWSIRYAKQYQFKLTLISFSSTVCTFTINSIDVNDVPFATKGDSIWIDVAANIADTVGNLQSNPLNRRVILDVTLPQPTWNIAISTNPFIPGQNVTEISVTSQTPLIDPDRFSMKLSIYDVIGNQVITTAMSQKGKGFSFVWNGYNRNMRIVGTGVYPAIITITENNSGKITKQIKIGVKK
jgi:fibro-slime domain-containing protein